ncbi:MAG: hypothetical protein D6824_06670 [Planctomycetota bacterium]|nr:MAG: hypothetical protein D6824_06670 [Planctomycetota bacterium]
MLHGVALRACVFRTLSLTLLLQRRFHNDRRNTKAGWGVWWSWARLRRGQPIAAAQRPAPLLRGSGRR